MPTYQELVQQASANEIPYFDLANLSPDEFQRQLQDRIAGQGGPQQSTGGTWGGPTGAESPHIDPITGAFVDPYAGAATGQGYFDKPGPNNETAPNGQQLMSVTSLDNAINDALRRGDTKAYQTALDAYRAYTGGLQPNSTVGITPEMVAMNARNPGGVNAGYQFPQNAPSIPSQTGGPTPFTYGGSQPQPAPPAQLGRTSGTPYGPNPTDRPVRGSQGQSNPEATANPSADMPLAQDGSAPINGRVNGPTTGQLTNNRPVRPGNATDQPAAGPPPRGIPTGGIPTTQPPIRTGGPVVATPPGSTPPTPPRTPGVNPPGPTLPPRGGSPIPGPTPPSGPISPYSPTPYGATPPTANAPYVSSAFPSWSTWNNGNPYQEGDPGQMAISQQNRATDYGNLFQTEFGGAYADAQAQGRGYGQAADTAYSDLYENPGFTGAESDMIQNGGIEGGLNSLRAGQGELDRNYLTPEEQAAIQGDPYGATRAFDPNTLNDLARTGTGATQSFFGNNYQKAQDALAAGAGRSDAAIGAYGANARGDLSTMRSDLQGAIDPTKLGISDAEVERLKEQAGRQVGFQYGAAIDELQRKAEAAGNVSPLALSAARERLLRSQAVDSANAVNNADLAAREKQRQAEQDISSRRIGVGTTLGNAGIGLEGDIANTGINANQNMTALNTGTQATYGTLGTNLGLNTTKQLTDTANTAGQTAIQQAQYGDTNNANRAATLATNRQNVNTNNLNTRFGQGTTTAAANSQNAATVGNARIAGQQAARNYWQGQNQFQGGQANAAAGQQLTGAQTSLSGQGQAGSTAVGNLNARRNPISITGLGSFTL